MKQPRFSIHDAFEEENDEAIRVYGSTVVSNVPPSRGSSGSAAGAAGGSSSTAATAAATGSATTGSTTPNNGTAYANNNGTAPNATVSTNELTCDPRFAYETKSIECIRELSLVEDKISDWLAG